MLVPTSSDTGLVSVRQHAAAMGNTAVVIATAHDEKVAHRATDAALARVRDLESVWSRFVPSSEISRFNVTGDARVLGPDSRMLVAFADRAVDATDGMFDARVLPVMTSLGYDRSLVDGRASSPALHRGAIDSGGIGKGLAADIAVKLMMEMGCHGALVSIGGDIGCDGYGDQPDGWVVDIESAIDGPNIARVALSSGGIATSSLNAKRWPELSATQSHLVDPRTLCSLDPTTREITQATVIAGVAAWAEVFATACLVATPTAALAMVDRVGVAALLQRADGSVVRSSCWSSFE